MDEHEIEELWRKQHSKEGKNQFRVTVVNPAEELLTGERPYAWGHSLVDGFEHANQFLKERMSSGLPTKNPLVIEIEEKQGKKRIWHITLEIKRGKWKGK